MTYDHVIESGGIFR